MQWNVLGVDEVYRTMQYSVTHAVVLYTVCTAIVLLSICLYICCYVRCFLHIHTHIGSGLDVHAGGVDLKFPHHENEVAYLSVLELVLCTSVYLN